MTGGTSGNLMAPTDSGATDAVSEPPPTSGNLVAPPDSGSSDASKDADAGPTDGSADAPDSG
jgi:hypothetical protein